MFIYYKAHLGGQRTSYVLYTRLVRTYIEHMQQQVMTGRDHSPELAGIYEDIGKRMILDANNGLIFLRDINKYVDKQDGIDPIDDIEKKQRRLATHSTRLANNGGDDRVLSSIGRDLVEILQTISSLHKDVASKLINEINEVNAALVEWSGGETNSELLTYIAAKQKKINENKDNPRELMSIYHSVATNLATHNLAVLAQFNTSNLTDEDQQYIASKQQDIFDNKYCPQKQLTILKELENKLNRELSTILDQIENYKFGEEDIELQKVIAQKRTQISESKSDVMKLFEIREELKRVLESVSSPEALAVRNTIQTLKQSSGGIQKAKDIERAMGDIPPLERGTVISSDQVNSVQRALATERYWSFRNFHRGLYQPKEGPIDINKAAASYTTLRNQFKQVRESNSSQELEKPKNRQA